MIPNNAILQKGQNCMATLIGLSWKGLVTLALAGGQINACKFSFIGLLKRKGEICFGIYMLFNPCLPTEIKNVTGSRNEIIKK